MKYKIVADSSCDLNSELKNKITVSLVPLILYIGDKELRDDDKLDRRKMLEDMKNSPTAPKTACPSPDDYIRQYKNEGSIFVVTLSSNASGSYSNAVLAKKMFLENNKEKFIHVFDSKSASVGETLIALKISELINKGISEIDIVNKVNKYIEEMKTFFLLDCYDNLIKAGRMNKIVGMLASKISIKPIMCGSDEGKIELIEKVRGSKKAFKRFVEVIGEKGKNLEKKVLGIAHCNCLEKAKMFKQEVLKRYHFKDIVIVEMGGLSSVYANDGGLVIAF